MSRRRPSSHFADGTFCACGHLGKWHFEDEPHACARCECAKFHIPVVRRVPDGVKQGRMVKRK